MKRIFKWLGIVIGGLLGLVIIFFVVVYAVTSSRMSEKFDVKTPALQVSYDEATLNEGRRIYISRGCVDCHGEKMEGKVLVDNAAVGTLSAPNLTTGKGGIGKRTVQEIDLAVRHGIAKDKRGLVFMPSTDYNLMNDKELLALAAYIQNAQPIDNEVPQVSPGPVYRTLEILNPEMKLVHAAHIDHDYKREQVTVAPNAEYGKTLAMGCIGCHGQNFSGGLAADAPPNTPPAANLTFHESGLKNWSYEDFDNAMRKGIRPDGSQIDPFMPYKAFSYLTDTELRAIWAYLQTVPPLEYGNR